MTRSLYFKLRMLKLCLARSLVFTSLLCLSQKRKIWWSKTIFLISSFSSGKIYHKLIWDYGWCRQSITLSHYPTSVKKYFRNWLFCSLSSALKHFYPGSSNNWIQVGFCPISPFFPFWKGKTGIPCLLEELILVFHLTICI